MVIVRPVRPGDLDSLVELTSQIAFGLTTLPHDRDVLRRRVLDSVHGFSKLGGPPRGETYLLVMEDLNTHAVVGTAGLVSKVGGFEPFYAYRLDTVVHESKTLGVRKEIQVLRLVAEHDGPTEIGSLFLAPSYRRSQHGRLLSLSRFVFVADHRADFENVILAEMRGILDEKGGSPFWDALPSHFFGVEYSKADSLVMKDKTFIADLVPRFPVYVPLLPKAAQEVINQVHPDSLPALKLLREEGFASAGMVDIFEGGPVVSCVTDEIRTVRESRATVVHKISAHPIESEPFIVSNTYAQGFRACAASLAIVPGKGIQITKETAAALDLKKGDAVRIVRMRPGIGEPDLTEGA